ncbi:Type I restriction modification DNA specificity domain-containing protein [Pseudomonas sp. NFPP19]|nr:Type I restriction modification DNA specificity domain-containing protein [Pseudomonas sp. NFPP19]
MIELQDIFDIQYGNKFDLNKLDLDPHGIPFVSRTSRNNGISARVKEIPSAKMMPAGSISVSLGGTKLLSSFVQDHPFYTAQNVAVLTPKISLTIQEKLYICLCIERNRFKYSAFGREANRTIKTLKIPSPTQCPIWVHSIDTNKFSGKNTAASGAKTPSIDVQNWIGFRYSELFSIERGRGPRIKDLDGTGETPFITSTDKNNGVSGFTPMSPMHSGNTISVNRNGSVAEAFYQPVPFCSTEDVHVFHPKFEMNKYIAMFLVTLIKLEKYRYNYGRKWGIARMNNSVIKLPCNNLSAPDWKYMENYIKTLMFSGKI